MSNDPKVVIADLERRGEAEVRELLAVHAFGEPKGAIVRHWLDGKNRERADAFSAEQIELQRRAADADERAADAADRAADAAHKANIIAIAAAVMAAIAIVVSIVGLAQ